MLLFFFQALKEASRRPFFLQSWPIQSLIAILSVSTKLDTTSSRQRLCRGRKPTEFIWWRRRRRLQPPPPRRRLSCYYWCCWCWRPQRKKKERSLFCTFILLGFRSVGAWSIHLDFYKCKATHFFLFLFRQNLLLMLCMCMIHASST